MYELQIFTFHYAVVTRLGSTTVSVYRPVMRVAWGKIDSVLKEHKHGHFAPYQLLRKSQVYLRGGGGSSI